MDNARNSFSYARHGKRAFDLAVAFTMLLLAAPVLATLALLARLFQGRPVLYRQTRPGLHGRPFTIYKFRTMHNRTDANGEPLPDAQRITALGRVMRKTSLDELPELFNVLRGEMSLVGPRPLLMDYLPLYTSEQARRHAVLPGVTGWAQVNGRNAITWEEKFALDLWYVDHPSFAVDLKILAQTVLSVTRCENISQQDHATMERFMGTR